MTSSAKSPDSRQRRAVRQKLSKPKVEALKSWAEVQLGRIPGKGDLAKAFRYGLKRWPSFSLFLDDGRVAIDNNPAERAIKPVVIGRKNFMFAGSVEYAKSLSYPAHLRNREKKRSLTNIGASQGGSDAGGETLADAMTIIETAKFSGLNPEAYLADVFARIQDHKINRIDELLPWNWVAKSNQTAIAA